MTRIAHLICLSVLFGTTAARADEPKPNELNAGRQTSEMRKWTDSTGKFSVTATLVEIKDGVVVLKMKDGRLKEVPITRLSASDQEWIKAGKPGDRTRNSPVEENQPFSLQERLLVEWRLFLVLSLSDDLDETYVTVAQCLMDSTTDENLLLSRAIAIRRGPLVSSPGEVAITEARLRLAFAKAKGSLIDAYDREALTNGVRLIATLRNNDALLSARLAFAKERVAQTRNGMDEANPLVTESLANVITKLEIDFNNTVTQETVDSYVQYAASRFALADESKMRKAHREIMDILTPIYAHPLQKERISNAQAILNKHDTNEKLLASRKRLLGMLAESLKKRDLNK